jgi:hypothetical protein
MDRMNSRLGRPAAALAVLISLVLPAACDFADLPMRKQIADLGETWKQVATLDSATPADGDLFGTSIAIAPGTLMVGAVSNKPLSEAVTVFEKSGGAWARTGSLPTTGIAPAPSLSSFGYSLAIAGTWAAVGSPIDNKVYLYQKAAGAWTYVQTLGAPANSALFGYSVDVAGEWLVVGDPEWYSGIRTCGAAHVYRLAAGTWTLANTIRPNGGLDGDYCGCSVALGEGWIAAGARGLAGGQGAVLLYSYDGLGHWGSTINYYENKRLTLAAPSATDGFGRSVAMRGKLLVAGAPGANAAYVYRDGGTGAWPLEATLTPAGASAGNSAGWTVDLSETVAVVGAPNYPSLASKRGAAFVFEFDGASWGQWPADGPILAAGSADQDACGSAVAVEGDDAVLGAYKTGAADRGAAYAYKRAAW